MFRDPVDIAIRYGKLEDSSYVALPLAEENRRVMVAAPDYLDRHGRPENSRIWHSITVCRLSWAATYDKWTFRRKGCGDRLR